MLNDRTERRTLVAVSAVVFVIQLLTIRSTVVIGEPYTIATHLKQGLGFVFEYPWDTTPTPTCFIPPLYVYFLYGILEIGGGLLMMQVFGLLFFHTANLFLYRFFRRHIARHTAFIGFVIFALYIPLWLLSEKVDPDGLNILLIAATIFVLDGIIAKPNRRRWIWLGILFGLQILIRPDILLGVLIFGVLLFVLLADKKEFWKGYALSVAIALAMVSPWTIRNYVVFGRFVLVSANSGYNLFLGNNPAAYGGFDQGAPTAESIATDSARIEYFAAHRSGVERDSYLFHVALDWARAHPWDVIKLAVRKFYFHWWQREASGHFIQVPLWMLAAYDIVSALLVVLGFIGIFSLDKRSRLLIITLFAYSTAVAMIFFAQSRHRALKVDPYLITLSVVGVERIFVRKKTIQF